MEEKHESMQYKKGYSDGYTGGYSSGYVDGYNEGYDKGAEQYREAVLALLLDVDEGGMPPDAMATLFNGSRGYKQIIKEVDQKEIIEKVNKWKKFCDFEELFYIGEEVKCEDDDELYLITAIKNASVYLLNHTGTSVIRVDPTKIELTSTGFRFCTLTDWLNERLLHIHNHKGRSK